MLPFFLLPYLANQRRAAYIGIVVALIAWAIILYVQNRRLFWNIVPLACIIGSIYLAAFWNGGGGPIGAPARAIRSAVAPQAGSEEDTSNLYRLIENVNTMFTIKVSTLLGDRADA
jgi:hypothetical protein